MDELVWPMAAKKNTYIVKKKTKVASYFLYRYNRKKLSHYKWGDMTGHNLFSYFQTSVTIEIRYQPMDGTVGAWSDGEFLDVPDDRDGVFAFETDSLLSGQSHGSGTSPGRSLHGSIPTFRKWVKPFSSQDNNMELVYSRIWMLWGTAFIIEYLKYAFKELLPLTAL